MTGDSMYDSYIRQYKHYAATYGPNTAIFLLVGKFYELYDILEPATGQGATSMRRAVETMNVHLTVKRGDAPGGRDGLFAGVPEQSLHKYAGMLTRENWTVVVIDQVKNARGDVTSREMSRILSPGTHLEAEGVATPDAAYLGGLWLEEAAWGTGAREPPTFGAVCLDLATGTFVTYEGSAAGRSDAWTADDLLHFFQVHPPRELVVWWRGGAPARPAEDTLRRMLGVPTALLHIRSGQPTEQGALEKASVREDVLVRCFKSAMAGAGLLGARQTLGLSASPRTERALVALLRFVEDHMPSATGTLRSPEAWIPTDTVFVGNHALTQLNMVSERASTASLTAPPDILSLFAPRCQTAMGRRAMRERLLYPISSPSKLRERLDALDALAALDAQAAQTLETTLRQIGDIPRLHRHLASGCLSVADVLLLDQSYACSEKLVELLGATPLAVAPSFVTPFSAYREAFAEVFDIEKARAASDDSFCMHPAHAPKVATIEAQLAACQFAIQKLLEELRKWCGLPSDAVLKLDYGQLGVHITAPKAIMTALVSKVRAAKGTFPQPIGNLEFHTKKSSISLESDTLNALYRAILRDRATLGEMIREELPRACDKLFQTHAAAMDALEVWVANVDVSWTLQKVGRERGFCRPELVDGEAAAVTLRELRHPLIEMQATRAEYVKHDVALDSATAGASGWLVYGMNASGKSSLMKAVGIAVLLAQAGSYVPATSMHITPFRGVYTRILSADNLWAGLSSFATEMTELREILRRADPWSLVLGDEVCSGTESTSATALVGASLEWLAARGARFIFATHLHDLMHTAAVPAIAGLRVWHLRVRYDAAADRLLYDRTLHPGAGSSLYGLEVARAMALPMEVLERAQQLRRGLLGTAVEEDAPASSWNTEIVRRACEVCGHAIVRDLEVHHIQQRAEDGSNEMRNLVVVCQECHDRHHAGDLAIGPLQQTSDGLQREVLDLSRFAYTGGVQRQAGQRSRPAGGLSEEAVATVQQYLREYPNCPPARLLYDLEHRESIRISMQRLRAIRAAMP